MKKYVLISAIVAGMLIGCGGGSSSDDDAKTPSTQQEVQKDKVQQGVDGTHSQQSDAKKDDKSKAENSTFKFTSDWLNGKTLYNVRYSGRDSKWKIAVCKFTKTNLSAYKLDSPNKKIASEYKITKEGYIDFFMEPDNEYENMKAVKKTDDYISLIWANRGDERLNSNTPDKNYFFFDSEKAKAFISSNAK